MAETGTPMPSGAESEAVVVLLLLLLLMSVDAAEDEEKARVFATAQKLRQQLAAAQVRVKLDERDGLSPGFKFNDWEMRGVPLRIELGPKDVASGNAVLARRDRPVADTAARERHLDERFEPVGAA